ncbi:MAG: N-acetylmuramoyl-L-alanine amidase [Calditrichaceae bacterium]|nr:N-acetylmuramoyl-L-alanine amidase [Calditrichaceae bacterium]MBN2709165.1 N-acetylmuramoyl-L-alanine amidase [Calditrichaceae bacterium]RQV96121.1 MAG: N-acetylmuramoyl-L-alanine amidase [Calditrichota bacterium]
MMLRRRFLQFLSGGLFSGLTGLFFRKPLFAMQDYGSQGKLVLILENGEKKQLFTFDKSGEYFISVKNFSDLTGLGIFTNIEKRKTVLYVQDTKIKFTADNPFVIINNDQIIQVVLEPFWKEGEIWIAVEELARLLSGYSALKVSYNRATGEVILGNKDINVTRVDVFTKQNGVMVQLSATKKFAEKDLSTKKVNNWFYLEIIGGKLDPKVINRSVSNELITEIQAVQLEQAASVAFKLKNDIIDIHLSSGDGSNDIILNLVTDQQLEKDMKAREDLHEQKKKWLIDTIVIDPGHGGKDPGAVGVGKIKEKDIVLPVALKLGTALKNALPDVNIVYTRDTDVFIPLWQRTKIANQANGKLFVSLHCNSNRSSKFNGFETYFLSSEKDERAKDVVMKENQSIEFEESEDKKRYEGINFVLATLAQNAFIKQSQYLASTVQKKMALKLKPLGMNDRGVKQGPFWVMVGATMPNVLIEMGFISNKFESKLLMQKSTQQKLADSICDGIVKYKTDFESSI